MSSDLTATIPETPMISFKELEDSLQSTLHLWCPLEKWDPSIISPTPEKPLQSSTRFLTYFPSLEFETPVSAIVFEYDESDLETIYMNRIPSDQRSFEVLSGTGFVRGKKGLGNFAVLAIIASVARVGHGLIIDASLGWMPEYFEDYLYDLDYVDDWMKAEISEKGFEGMITYFDRYWGK